MLTFTELGSLGRLGNQMFQYAALRSAGLRLGFETKIPNPELKGWHGQNCMLGNLNIRSEYLSNTDMKKIKYQYIEKDYMNFDNKVFSLPDNTNMHGFFQSIHYFQDFKEEIIKELMPRQQFLDTADKKFQDIKNANNGYEIVSLHLRRGDNTDGSNPSKELNEMYGKSGDLEMNSFYGKYLVDAKQRFKNKKVKFLIFTGGSRSDGNSNETDMEWCRRNFVGEEYLFSEENDVIIDFSMISRCDHNIVSHISSFGWWAAYLNQGEGIVIAPSNYHPDRPTMGYRQGFYPKKWILV